MLGLQMVPQPGTGTVGFLAVLAVQVLGSEAEMMFSSLLAFS